MPALKEDLQLLVRAGLAGGMTVVEFGCSTGRFAREVARVVGSSGRVIGVDSSAFNISRARELAAQEALENVVLEVSDERATLLRSDSADACVARHLLSHTARPDEVIREMTRVVAPGGLVAVLEADEGLAVYEPEPPALADLRSLLVRSRVSGEGSALMGRSLYRLLRGAGLEGVRVIARTANSTEFQTPPGPERMSHPVALTRAVEAFVEKGDLTREQASRYLKSLEEVTRDPSTFIFVCEFFALGRKPLRCA